jgi:hypothetical protein
MTIEQQSIVARMSDAIDEDSENLDRIFTLAEARALLPDIQVLIDRFNQARVSATRVAEQLDEIERSRTRENRLELARPLRQAREDLGEHAEAMREVIRTVHKLGLEIKHLDPALLDFPAMRDDHIVYLCWQEGEATIEHWHEIDAGFAGRQILP